MTINKSSPLRFIGIKLKERGNKDMSKVQEKIREVKTNTDWFDIFSPFLIILAVSLLLYSVYKDIVMIVKLFKSLKSRFHKDAVIETDDNIC